ncbi:MAG TPA: Zn-dependent alcohol dehydrogenase [Novosphingobium sp.]|nr:Zn-dependent alcohol dehydrogenase [Novosphingobium sp.]
MKAAVFREVGKPLAVENIRIDKPGPHEVLIRTVASGLCHSDLHFIDGVIPAKFPVVLGHESAGIVEQVGSEVRTVRPGDHVITCTNSFCGHCSQCLTGHANLCDSPETRRGEAETPRLSDAAGAITHFANVSGFAEQIITHEHGVVAMRRDMPFDRAALIGCAVSTGFGAVVNAVKLQPGETIVIIGCGGVGLSAINSAAIAGAGRIIAIDLAAEKRQLATLFGATDFICAAETDPVEAVIELTGGGAPHVLECIGSKRTAEQAFAMLARGGMATILGMIAPGVNLEIPGAHFIAEKKIQGCLMGSSRFPVEMPRLVDFYLSGRLKLDDLISRRISLEQVNEGFDEMRGGKLARSVIMFDH